MFPPAPTRYERTQPIPDDVRTLLPEPFLEQFSADPAFVGLGPGLPRLAHALATRYAPPELAVEWATPRLALCSLVFGSGAGDLWGQVHSRNSYELGSTNRFDALPKPFASYYRWLDGIQLVEAGAPPAFGWIELPCAYAARGELQDYLRTLNVPNRSSDALYQQFGSKSLQVWIRSADGHVLFADESNRSGRLFHLRREDPRSVSVISNDEFLDDYAAHVVTQRTSRGFDFARWLAPL